MVLKVSDGDDGVTGQELSSRLESVGHSLGGTLDRTSSSDRSSDDLSASSSIVRSLGTSSVERRGTAPAPTRAELTATSASGLVLSTASVVARDSDLAEIRSLHDLLSNLLANSSVEVSLVGLLVQSTNTTPAPLGAELFSWASSSEFGTASFVLGNSVFTSRVSSLNHHGKGRNAYKQNESRFVHCVMCRI